MIARHEAGAACDDHVRSRMRPPATAGARAALALAFALALGCSSALDLETMRSVLSGPERSDAPVLRETPPSSVAPPTGVRAVSGELREVPLAWDPPATPAQRGVVVERALAAEGPFERIAVVPEAWDASLIDRGVDLARKAAGVTETMGLGDGQSYYYRLRSFDAEGRVSAHASPVVAAKTAPLPPPPADLRAFSQLPRKAALAWRASEMPSVAGYVIERSPSASGPFARVGRVDGRFRTTWVDEALGDLRVFHYRVAALNHAGAEGPPGEAVRVVTKAEPLPPGGLRLTGEAAARRLAWDASPERDVVRYRVELRRSGDDAFEPAGTTEAPELALPEKTAHGSVRVIAIDRDGLESAPSTLLELP